MSRDEVKLVGAQKLVIEAQQIELKAQQDLGLAQKAIDACRSVGVGLGPCTLPAVGHPNFTIEPGTMEVGIGHHGEPGTRVEPLKTANEVADAMLEKTRSAGAQVALMNGGSIRASTPSRKARRSCTAGAS